MPVDPADQEALKKALAGYKTYREVIEKLKVTETVPDQCHYGIFQESHDPPLTELTQGLEWIDKDAVPTG